MSQDLGSPVTIKDIEARLSRIGDIAKESLARQDAQLYVIGAIALVSIVALSYWIGRRSGC